LLKVSQRCGLTGLGPVADVDDVVGL